jgi:hypothetical protein
MMISRADHGKFGNWAIIMYSQLIKELIRWDKCQKIMIEGIIKREPKKRCMPFYHSPRSYVSEVVSIRSIITREEETCKITLGERKKKIHSKGKIHQEQKAFEPYTHLS